MSEYDIVVRCEGCGKRILFPHFRAKWASPFGRTPDVGPFVHRGMSETGGHDEFSGYTCSPVCKEAYEDIVPSASLTSIETFRKIMRAP